MLNSGGSFFDKSAKSYKINGTEDYGNCLDSIDDDFNPLVYCDTTMDESVDSSYLNADSNLKTTINKILSCRNNEITITRIPTGQNLSRDNNNNDDVKINRIYENTDKRVEWNDRYKCKDRIKTANNRYFNDRLKTVNSDVDNRCSRNRDPVEIFDSDNSDGYDGIENYVEIMINEKSDTYHDSNSRTEYKNTYDANDRIISSSQLGNGYAQILKNSNIDRINFDDRVTIFKNKGKNGYSRNFYANMIDNNIKNYCKGISDCIGITINGRNINDNCVDNYNRSDNTKYNRSNNNSNFSPINQMSIGNGYYGYVKFNNDGNVDIIETCGNNNNIKKNNNVKMFNNTESGNFGKVLDNNSRNNNKNRKINKKKYICQYCNRTFGWSTDLKRHILVHTGERPFKCDICMASFTRKFLLQKHSLKLHHCLTPNEISDLNKSVAENIMEIKAKMIELESGKNNDRAVQNHPDFA